jgi:hypothetical protein
MVFGIFGVSPLPYTNGAQFAVISSLNWLTSWSPMAKAAWRSGLMDRWIDGFLDYWEAVEERAYGRSLGKWLKNPVGGQAGSWRFSRLPAFQKFAPAFTTLSDPQT